MTGSLLLQAFYKLFADAKTAHVRGPRPTKMARFASLAVIATETPYRLPANIDPERMVRALGARAGSAVSLSRIPASVTWTGLRRGSTT